VSLSLERAVTGREVPDDTGVPGSPLGHPQVGQLTSPPGFQHVLELTPSSF
jgi:hypothetical protein